MRSSIQASMVLIKERLSELEAEHLELKGGINYWNSAAPETDPTERRFYKRHFRNKLSANNMRRRHWILVLEDHKELLTKELYASQTTS